MKETKTQKEKNRNVELIQRVSTKNEKEKSPADKLRERRRIWRSFSNTVVRNVGLSRLGWSSQVRGLTMKVGTASNLETSSGSGDLNGTASNLETSSGSGDLEVSRSRRGGERGEFKALFGGMCGRSFRGGCLAPKHSLQGHARRTCGAASKVSPGASSDTIISWGSCRHLSSSLATADEFRRIPIYLSSPGGHP